MSASPPSTEPSAGKGTRGRKSKRLKLPNLSKPYDAPLLSPDDAQPLIGLSEKKLRLRKGKMVLNLPDSSLISLPPSTSDFSGHCRAGPASAALLARSPEESGMDAETRSQVLQDLQKCLVSSTSSPTDADIHQLAANAEARVLAQFQQILTAPQPPVTDTCMDYIGFDVDLPQDEDADDFSVISESVDEDLDLADVPENDFLYQALVDEGYSRGDLEQRFGLLPQS